MPALTVENLTKRFGDVLAVDSVSFSVEEGEIFGYLGPNGAGKTTTIRALLGFINPTAGTGRVLDTDIRDRKALVEVKQRVGHLSDDQAFDEQATGAEILDLHAAVKGDDRRDKLLDLFDPPLDRQVRDYSSGNVQRLGLVTTFMHDPELVILDEPTGGLDPLVKHRFAEFLRSERDRGVTIFLSSHVLSEVRRLCDRVGIIRDGQLVTVDPVETLLSRSGKVVRLNSANPIPNEFVEFAGVHDLETSVSDDLDVDSDTEFTECTFTFTGDINVLLGRLRGHELVDVSIEEAPLEDVFLRFYGGDEDV